MTTAPIHSLTHGGIIRAAKSVIATLVAAASASLNVQRFMVAFSLVDWLMRLHRNHRSRRQLAALDSRLLADIGVSEQERRIELRKPFWKNQEPG